MYHELMDCNSFVQVMGMIEKAETEYQELMQKLEVIANDKKQIQVSIDHGACDEISIIQGLIAVDDGDSSESYRGVGRQEE